MKIVVIGETCVDKFVYSSINRLSPEAPVPILNPTQTTENPGMAGNVVANIKSLQPDSIIHIITQPEYITKTRYVDIKTNHMFIRVDEGEEHISDLQWTPKMDVLLAEADIVIVSDYNKGFLNNSHLKAISKKSKLSILDSKRKLTQDILNEFSFIKLNESESRNNYELKHPGLIITLGSKGAYYNGELIPQENPQQTIDVSGAGDTFVAAFALKFLETLEERVSIEYANEMAGIVVGKRGVVTPV
jgi:D-beta-D-heptose 7-phosphate kinase/D-beta-D-heptose 1-phosphate adenosyltransferase